MKRVLLLAIMLALPGLSLAEEDKSFFATTVEPKIAECKDHYDIELYFKIAVGADIDNGITDETINSLETFFNTGKLAVPETKKSDAVAMQCAQFAEGMLVGGLGNEIVSVMVNGIALAIGDAFGQALESIGEGFGGEQLIVPQQ